MNRTRSVFPMGTRLALAVVLLGLAAPVAAQDGTLIGRVIDAESAAPLSGAAVQVVGQTGLQSTNQSGQFQVSLPAGTYSVVVTLIGHETGRMDGIDVSAGQTTNIELALRSQALVLNPVVVTASRRQEKTLDAPASISTVSSAEIARIAAPTITDHVAALPGIDRVQTGLTQSNIVARGFNNVFSGSLLTIQDNRYARVPSLRLNANNMIPATDLDVERIEVSLGPGAALYGPNAANGVMHIITSSPIDRQGTSVSLAGGERSVFHGQFRSAVSTSDRFGFKISGQYFRGDDFEFVDPVETLAAQADPTNPLIGARVPEAERYSADARFDFRFENDAELVINGGLNSLGSSVELTGVGAGQADDWQYRYGQARFTSGRLFAQAFINQSDAGDSFLLRTGGPIVDKSRALAAQVQHGIDVGERQSFTYGIDWQSTEPRTGGTITGRNEDDDKISEIGAYLHSETALSDKLDFVAAVRVDDHSRLTDVNFSPRAALVFKPAEDQTFRATFNRAFSTPTSNNLFLDLLAAQIPIVPGINYDVRTLGVPSGGFTFDDECAGGFMDFCMRSPFMPGQLPANAPAFWDALVAQLVPAALQPALSSPGALPGDPALGTVFRRFDQVAAQTGEGSPFPLDIAGIGNIGDIQSTINNTIELGYKGLINDKVLLAVDVYRSAVSDFVGPLRVETPNVFLDPGSVQDFVLSRLSSAIGSGAVTPEEAAAIIEGLAGVPLGTVVPDQVDTPDLVLTYRNFGDVDFWGADLSAQILVSDRVRLNGSYSFVSEECFDFNEDGSCQSADDIALNAPTNKGSLGLSFDDQSSGFSAQGRFRSTGGFPTNSGVYVGDIESYTVVDAGLGYRLPFQPSTRVSLNVTNLLNNEHREFIGAPEIGRLLLFRVQYDF
ncbi:MAG: TonB-dependent receptor domain-containing protein [Longimicrobiales bacterium]